MPHKYDINYSSYINQEGMMNLSIIIIQSEQCVPYISISHTSGIALEYG